MENLTDSSSSNMANSLEMKFLLTSPNILLIILLVVGIWQMYLGIEITHPVYMALFCNLVTHLCASIVEMLISPFLVKIRVTTLVKGTSTLCVLFHCCCWCVLSILRYIYIIHSDWLVKKIPENKTITKITLLAIYTLYLVCSITLFLPTIYFGWPYKEMYELEKTPKLICILSILLTYFVLLGSSGFFYFLILHHRGKMGQNSVEPSIDKNLFQDKNKKESQSSIFIPRPHCSNLNTELSIVTTSKVRKVLYVLFYCCA